MKFNFKRKVLKNGMVLLFEKRDLPVVTVAFAVRNGGINESKEEKGISHFIEHMLYKGTPTRDAKKIADEIELNGGELNGFTSETMTAYWCKIPSNHLHVALDVLSDMVKNPLFDEKEIEKERKVIFEEMKMRKDNPQVYVNDEISEKLYDEPVGLNLIGSFETMSSIDRKKMVAKFKQVYCPNNMIFCVVGNADFDELVSFAEKNFNDSRGDVPKFEVKKLYKKVVEKRRGVDQANLVFAFHVPLADDKKSYSALVLSSLLAEGMSSRLFNEIREKRNLAYAVKGFSDVHKDFAFNGIYVGTTKENVDKVKELILEELKKVSNELENSEVESAKEKLVGNYKISMEDTRAQMMNLLGFEVDGTADDFYDFEKNIRSVKVEEVRSLARIKDYSFFALVPE